MARAGFYNDNLYRDYPFVTRVNPLSNDLSSADSMSLIALSPELIVDCGFIMDLDAAYAEDAGHTVYLYSVTRAGDILTFDFRTTAPGGAGQRALFTRDTAVDPEFTSEWVEATDIPDESSNSSSQSSESLLEACGGATWRGYLVTGSYAATLEALPEDGSLLFAAGLWQVLPARMQSLWKSYLRSVNLANYGRTMASVPAACGGSEQDTPLYVGEVCLQGNLAFKEGYNCVIRQDRAENAIIIGAGVGAGAGRPCDEVPRYADETAPEDSPYLSGGPGCGDILKSINGVTGRRIQITAGPGFLVYTDPELPNTLIVNRNMQGMAVCIPDPESSESLSSEGV